MNGACLQCSVSPSRVWPQQVQGVGYRFRNAWHGSCAAVFRVLTTCFMQALKAYTDGVLSDMQDLWMHQQCLNPQKQRALVAPSFTSLQPVSTSASTSPSPRSRRRASGSSISPPPRMPSGGTALVLLPEWSQHVLLSRFPAFQTVASRLLLFHACT